MFNNNQWQKSWHTLYFPYRAVLVIASPSPPHKTMLSFIHLTFLRYSNIDWGEKGGLYNSIQGSKIKGLRHGTLFHSESQVLLPLIVD